MNKESEFIINKKLLVFGDEGTGKSTLSLRLSKNKFQDLAPSEQSNLFYNLLFFI